MNLTFPVTITDEKEQTLRRVWRKAVDSGEATDASAKLYGERVFLGPLVEDINASIESWSNLRDRKAALIDAIKSGDVAVISALETAIAPQ